MAETCSADGLPIAFKESPECNDLQSSPQRISFDVNQMINTFLGLSECAPSPSNTGFTAYLESCLLHIRNLIQFFRDPKSEKITIRDFVRGGRSIDVTLAPDLASVRDLIDQYLAAGNRMRTSDCSLPVDEILGSAVVGLGDAFKSFVEQLPAGSVETKCLENSTRAALGKLKTVEDVKE